MNNTIYYRVLIVYCISPCSNAGNIVNKLEYSSGLFEIVVQSS